jgi:hypothetical protein
MIVIILQGCRAATRTPCRGTILNGQDIQFFIELFRVEPHTLDRFLQFMLVEPYFPAGFAPFDGDSEKGNGIHGFTANGA